MVGKDFAVSIKVGFKSPGVQAGIRRMQRDLNRGFGAIRSGAVSAGRSLVRFTSNAVQNSVRSMLRMARVATFVGLGMATAFGVTSTRAFADYEQSVANAMSVTQLFGDEFTAAQTKLFKFGLELSKTSTKLPTEIAGGFYSQLSAGFTPEQVTQTAPGILALAEGTRAPTDVVSELATSQLKAFHYEVGETNRVVNVLGAAIQGSRMNVQRLAVSLPYASAQAVEYGLSIEEVTAALSVGVDRGLRATTAGNSFRMMLAKSVNVTNEGQQALAKYGLGVKDINIQTRGLVPVLETLRRKQVSVGDMNRLFGVESAGLVSILRANVGEYVRMRDAITGTDSAFRMQRRQINTVQGQWNAFRGDVQKMQIEFTGGMAPALRVGIAHLRNFAQRLSDLGIARRAGQWVATMGARIAKALAAAFTPANLARAKTFMVDVYETVKAGLGRLWEVFRGGFAALGQMLPTWFEQMWSWLKGGGQFPVNITGQIFGDMARMAGAGVNLIIGHVDRLMANAFGPAQWAAAKQQLATIAKQWVEMGKAVIPALAAILPHIVAVVQWVAKWVGHNPKLAVGLGLLIHFAGPIGALAKGFGSVAKYAGKAGGAIKWVGNVAKSMAAWFAGGEGLGAVIVKSLGGVLGKIVGIVGALYGVYEIVRTIIMGVQAFAAGRAAKQAGERVREMGGYPAGMTQAQMNAAPAIGFQKRWEADRQRNAAPQVSGYTRPSAMTPPSGTRYSYPSAMTPQQQADMQRGRDAWKREAVTTPRNAPGAAYLGGSAAGPGGRQAAVRDVHIHGDVYGVDDLDRRIHRGVRTALA